MEIDPETATALKREFIQSIKDENLILVPREFGEFALDFVKAKKKLLRKTAVTAYMVSKYKLLGDITLKTVKAMVKDGRIGKNEHYHDAAGKLYVLTSAINRINEK